MRRLRTLVTTVTLGLALGAAACESAELIRPTNVTAIDPLFERYVSIGNSIASGFQSGGLNDSLQLRAYPVLLAKQMQTRSYVPLMNPPGCPGPLINVFTGERVGGGGGADCFLRASGGPPPPYLTNLALPGADVIELLNYTDGQIVPSVTDVYRTFLLGGRTELEAAALARPTFVTMWIGSGDALNAILETGDAGNASLVTPPATFATQYAEVMDDLDAIGTIQGGVLIGAVQVTGAPYVTQARVYYALQAAIPTLTVNPNCLDFAEIQPGDTAFVLVPFHYGAPLIQQAAGGTPTTLDCSVPEVITVAEATNLIVTVAQYNAAIAQEAADRNWVFVDPNPLLAALAADTTAIRVFPAFPPYPASVTAPFGTALSRDGIHPSSTTHYLVAQSLITAINARYSTAIPQLP